MNKKRNWVIAIVITAATGLFTLQTVSAPATNQTVKPETSTATITALISTKTPTQTATPSYEGCSYMWAYHDSPEVSAKIDASVHALNPSASAHVQLYGEDCVYADGHSTFGTMETDFFINLPVENLNVENEFGVWVRQVMDTIIAIPNDEIPGSKGYVEFHLTKTESEQIVFRVSIYDYQNIPAELTGAELFRKFYTSP